MSRFQALPDQQSDDSDDHEADLRVHPLIAQLNPQPGDQRRFVILTGFIGEETDGLVRVYPGLDLGTYYEIPIDDIVYAESADPDQAARPTGIVLKASAQVRVVQVSNRTIEAGFLSGAIAEANLGAALRSMDGQIQDSDQARPEELTSPTGPVLPKPPPTSCLFAGKCICDVELIEQVQRKPPPTSCLFAGVCICEAT
jgi:hypothetical protein